MVFSKTILNNTTFNQTPRVGYTSKYKGVGWWARDSNWRTKIGFMGKTIHVGYFNTEEEVALAYNAKAKELFGEFAHLNTIYEK